MRSHARYIDDARGRSGQQKWQAGAGGQEWTEEVHVPDVPPAEGTVSEMVPISHRSPADE